MLRIFSPHSLMTKKLGADFQRGEGRGTRDGKNGRARLLLSRKWQRMATGDWRLQRQKLLSAENFFGSAETLPSRKTLRYSLLTIRHSPFATRHSLLAIRRRFLSPSPFLRFTVSPFLASLAAHFYSFPASPFPALCFAAMMSARI
jgi:hypothetical protein